MAMDRLQSVARDQAMSQPETRTAVEAGPVLPGPDEPPVGFAREEAAYAREAARLVRDHRGKVALVHQDEVVGVYPTADEALSAGYRRFGYVRLMVKEIGDPGEPPAFVSQVDIDHPSVRRVR
jgi:hypothetical protein